MENWEDRVTLSSLVRIRTSTLLYAAHETSKLTVYCGPPCTHLRTTAAHRLLGQLVILREGSPEPVDLVIRFHQGLPQFLYY